MNKTTTFQMMVREEWMNRFGSLHGGEYAKFMDELAGVTADRYAPLTFVTGTIHHLRYLNPVYAGDVLKGVGEVVLTGHHSILIEVRLFVIHRLTQEEKPAAHAFFTMVQKERGANAPMVPPLPVKGELFEKRRARLRELLAQDIQWETIDEIE